MALGPAGTAGDDVGIHRTAPFTCFSLIYPIRNNAFPRRLQVAFNLDDRIDSSDDIENVELIVQQFAALLLDRNWRNWCLEGSIASMISLNRELTNVAPPRIVRQSNSRFLW
jgi:hypothetical protein